MRDIDQAESEARAASEKIIGEWVDEKCSRLWRELAALRTTGKHLERGGEYDAKLAELRKACDDRLQAVGLQARGVSG